MAEDLAANLRNYELQLNQVEAALKSDADNEELLKLKVDLEQVIDLTKQLMGNANAEIPQDTTHQFRAGDPCMAPWSEDGQFYEAKIEDITSDGQCTVTFTGLGKGKGRISEVCLVSLLKPIGGKRKFKPAAAPQSAGASSSSSPGGDDGNQSKKPKLDSRQLALKKKKKRENRQEKMKAIEEEQEKVKSSWQQFAQKASNKHLKGATKKSIFASPESVTGKVGVGTCGIGGKGMTEIGEHAASKHWKKEKPISGPDFGASASFASFMSKLPGSSFPNPSTSKKY